MPNLAVVESVHSIKTADALNKACEAAARPHPLGVMVQVLLFDLKLLFWFYIMVQVLYRDISSIRPVTLLHALVLSALWFGSYNSTF